MGFYLVTGGCGFIGSHLCRELLRRGHTVRVLDNLSTGKRTSLPSTVPVVIADTADPDAVRDAMSGVEGCFHLAAVASVERCTRDWLGSHRTNLGGAVAVFDAARGNRVPVVYASSAAVYGDARSVPIAESTDRNPLSVYGADKLGCELHAAVATRAYGVPTVGLRFFNIYGPGQDPTSPYSGVISIFCDRVRTGRPITIYGDGGQIRDFVFVADAVAALVRAMDIRPSAPLVLNVCTGVPVAVLDLAHMIAELSGCAPAIAFERARTGDIRRSLGDASAMLAALQLSAATPLREGLAQTMAAAEAAPLSRPPGKE